MVLDTLALTDFRNYENASVAFAPGVNVICGENAAGKTNLLEAAFYFAAGEELPRLQGPRADPLRLRDRTRGDRLFRPRTAASFAVGFPKGESASCSATAAR